MSTHLHKAPNARRGFTLVELLVVLVIIAILSSLTLAGLASARQRSKVAKTQSTLRKLNDVIMPQYDDFLRRRLAQSGTTPIQRLSSLRIMQALEMPDSWGDVTASGTAIDAGPAYARTAAVRSYGSFKGAINATRTDEWGSAECLHMIVSRSGRNSAHLENFRTDEVSDIDNDNAPEFKDAWNTPIKFIRWAPGYSDGVSTSSAWKSPIQVADATNFHDPFDFQRVDPTGYALYPLLVSAGPDEEMRIQESPAAGAGILPSFGNIMTITSGSAGAAEDDSKARDNITNHDLMKR